MEAIKVETLEGLLHRALLVPSAGIGILIENADPEDITADPLGGGASWAELTGMVGILEERGWEVVCDLDGLPTIYGADPLGRDVLALIAEPTPCVASALEVAEAEALLVELAMVAPASVSGSSGR